MPPLAVGCFVSAAVLTGAELYHAWQRRRHPEHKVQNHIYVFSRITCAALALGTWLRGACLALALPPAVALIAGDVMTTLLLSTLLIFAVQAEKACRTVHSRRLWCVYGALQGALWVSCAAFAACRVAAAGWERDVSLIHGIENMVYIAGGGARTVFLFRHLEQFVIPVERKAYLRFVWKTLSVLCALLVGIIVIQLWPTAQQGGPQSVDWSTTACHALTALYLQLTVRPLRRAPPARAVPPLRLVPTIHTTSKSGGGGGGAVL